MKEQVMNMKTIPTTVSQQRLRELAPRAVRVVSEHKGEHIGVEAMGPSLVAAAEAYIKVYDDAVIVRAAQRREMDAGREALEGLWQQMRVGVAMVQHAMPSFDAGELQGTLNTPDRLLSDAHKLIELIAQGTVPEGKAISGLIAGALEKAEGEWTKAQNARVALQQTQVEVRKHALLLNRELVALRRVLHTVLGTSHLAYQTLRTSRVASPEIIDEDDSVVEETEDDVVAAVTNGATNGTTNGKGHTAFNLGVTA
jgi:hypothetical protein